ncbi:magnesium/cobalt transporter CorA [Cohnella sp. GCM10027633]|uniref:magnesium/cobalt transporter CorA n=1 Tax=unclassified Cohnella TaxID=2636738 RepID=UPI0036418944
MIRTIAATNDARLLEDVPLERLSDEHIAWYWVDFSAPTAEEIGLLGSYFRFHPLAIEDCMHFLQRPKVDQYDDTHFFVMHSLHPETREAEEIDFFLGPRGIVTFHHMICLEIDEVRQRLLNPALEPGEHDHTSIAYWLIDSLVDNYFPSVFQIEDQLNELEDRGESERNVQVLTEQVYRIRAELLRLRRTVIPMRDLLYRITNTDKIPAVNERKAYFTDIYDHLLKLAEMIESNREVTADLRDSYDSLRSNRMNAIMKTLTVITTIFMPLTFIAGVYGMNFVHMPELDWQWGYFGVIGVMMALGAGMFIWFKRKGWFD